MGVAKIMFHKSLLVIGTHGTYGRDDEAYGTLMVCNTFLAKGINTTLILIKDGICMAKRGQSPVGMPNNLNELKDFLDLGGRLVCIKESLNERGIKNNELIKGAEIMSLEDIIPLIESNPISLTF